MRGRIREAQEVLLQPIYVGEPAAKHFSGPGRSRLERQASNKSRSSSRVSANLESIRGATITLILATAFHLRTRFESGLGTVLAIKLLLTSKYGPWAVPSWSHGCFCSSGPSPARLDLVLTLLSKIPRAF